MNIDSDYGYKKWKMKRRGEEDSELERALMIIDEEMEIWAKKKEVKDEVDDGKVWGIEEKIDYWKEQHVYFVTESKYWEIMYGYLGDNDHRQLSKICSFVCRWMQRRITATINRNLKCFIYEIYVFHLYLISVLIMEFD